MDPLPSDLPSPSLKERLLAPLRRLFPEAKNQRSCPAIPDEDWIEYGLERGLIELESGCVKIFRVKIVKIVRVKIVRVKIVRENRP